MPPANNFVNWPCTALYNLGVPTNVNVCLISAALFWGGLLIAGFYFLGGHRA